MNLLQFSAKGSVLQTSAWCSEEGESSFLLFCMYIDEEPPGKVLVHSVHLADSILNWSSVLYAA